MDDNHDDEAPPPPYSAIDPMQLQDTDHNVSSSGNIHNVNHSPDRNPASLETSFSSLHIHAPSPSILSTPSPAAPTPSTESRTLSGLSPTTSPTHLAYYAEQRQPLPLARESNQETLVHHMTIYARSQSRDFPRRPRCWNSRANEINQHDWDTFLNFLFPPHLGPAASSDSLNPHLRAEIERDRKDRAQETDEQRLARIKQVVAEWNEQFFGLHGVHVTCTYVADMEEGPGSSLCPNCYPQATEASRMRDRLIRTPSMNAPIPVSSEILAGTNTIPRRPVPQATPQPPLDPRFSSPAFSPIDAANQGQNLPSTSFDQRDQPAAFWKSNPMSWASQVNSMAAQYAARVSNQAQEYGRSIEESALSRSRQVEMHSKRIEQNALAHAKHLETYALAQGQRIENASGRFTNWASDVRRRGQGLYPTESPNGPSPNEANRSTFEVHQRQQRPRRKSSSSDSSSSSVSSISSVSSMSDLEPEDLTSIRQQLSSLDNYHSHELYQAVVSLRKQLQTLKKARANSRIRAQRARAQPWRQWDSPAEARDREQRHIAMKRETKLLREKFDEIERRAKSEVHELKKTKKEKLKKQRQCNRSQMPQHEIPTLGSSRTDPNICRQSFPQAFSGSLDPSVSEPFYQYDSRKGDPTLSQQHNPPGMDPHQAAKAWTESQRAKVKQIKKANKERLKEIHKEHKMREKEQRKAIKKANKQKHSLTQNLGASTSSSSTLTLPETGTIRRSVSSGHGSGAYELDGSYSMHPREVRDGRREGERRDHRYSHDHHHHHHHHHH